MILGKFILGLLGSVLALSVIAFICNIIDDHKPSKVAEFIFDVCMRCNLILMIEVVFLILIEIFSN